jgi:DNA-binding response OmpR family regulator
MKILLVEDEQQIADFVCAGLSQRGFRIEHCADGHIGLQRAREGCFDAIVLDIMLPGIDGLSILKSLRAAGDPTPVVLLTARGELNDRIAGLDLGADDYIAKPFFVEELAARLNALVRRAVGERTSELQAGDLVLDQIARELRCGNQSVELTGREFALLAYLMRSPDGVFTRGQILEHVWGYDFDPMTNVVDVCIRRLRSKIASIAGEESASRIEAVRGAGYRFLRGA